MGVDENARLRRLTDERYASYWLGAAMLIAAATVLWLGRDTTFWIDELVWLLQTPNLDLDGALQPHVGHLVLTTRLVYAAMLGAFGDGYLPFRLLAIATVLLAVGLTFTYLGRRVGRVAALAPCIVLLFFGSDFLHVLVGNAFTVMFAVACGVGAFLALDRRDLRGDVTACALLSLGVVTYTTALAFLAGAAIRILVDQGRWRRIWVLAMPAAIYGSWLLWAHASGTGPDGQASLSNALLTPVWGFQSLGAILTSLAGLDYTFAGSDAVGLAEVAGVLALIAIVAFALRVRGGALTASLWGTLAVLLAFWVMSALVSNAARPPDASRYMFPGAVIVLMVIADAARGMRLSPGALIAVFAVAAVGFATNLALLRDAAATQRSTYTVQARAAFAGLDLAGSRSVSYFEPPTVPDGSSAVGGNQSPLNFPFAANGGDPGPVPLYLEVARRYGALGYTPAELRGFDDAVRAHTDAVLAAALGLALERPVPGEARADCMERVTGPGANSVSARLPPGGAVLETQDGTAEVEVSRFAEETGTPVGSLAPGTPAALRIPTDAAGDPWNVSVGAARLRLCPLQ